MKTAFIVYNLTHEEVSRLIEDYEPRWFPNVTLPNMDTYDSVHEYAPTKSDLSAGVTIYFRRCSLVEKRTGWNAVYLESWRGFSASRRNLFVSPAMMTPAPSY